MLPVLVYLWLFISAVLRVFPSLFTQIGSGAAERSLGHVVRPEEKEEKRSSATLCGAAFPRGSSPAAAERQVRFHLLMQIHCHRLLPDP